MYYLCIILDNYESSMQSVCIMLNGEESELRFINEGEISVRKFLFIVLICNVFLMYRKLIQAAFI